MKKLNWSTNLFIIFIITLAGCSTNDDAIEIREQFLTAIVDGEEYRVGGANPYIDCEKLLTHYGSINLAVKAQTEEGKIIKFLILNYRGPSTYLIGNRIYATGTEFLNGNWLEYAESLPAGVWNTKHNTFVSDGAYIDITGDDGDYLSGTFSFNAQAELEENIRSISEGKFSIAFKR